MTLGTVIILSCILWNPKGAALWFAGPIIVLIGCLNSGIYLVRGYLSKNEEKIND